jgi:urea transport system ATP-binding protein
MTPRESERTGELLLALASKHTLMVIDHDMTFVRQIASKVTVLHEGRLLCQGTIREVQNDPKVIEVYLGHHKIEKEPQLLTTVRTPLPNGHLMNVGASPNVEHR